STPDRLIGVEVNGVTEASLHISETDANGVATMRALDGVDIPVGDTAVLEPGAMHVMLMGLTAPLLAGDMVPATLIFEKAGRVQIELMVLNADGTEAPMDHSKMDHSTTP
ncbi:MAG: copper chaperone PCu(A)C, partial [Cypionkella sp.]|nr:copper chaperone PCu(A)C [Cypionkella sp.]